MEKTMMVVNPPQATDPGQYILLLQRRNSSPFSDTSSGGFPIAVDYLEAAGDVIRGYLDDRKSLVVEFPRNTPYVLVDRANVYFLSLLDAAKEELDVSAQLKALREQYELPAAKQASEAREASEQAKDPDARGYL